MKFGVSHYATVFSLILLAIVSFSCEEQVEDESNRLEFEIEELNDSDYPDNPDIGFRHSDYNTDAFKKGALMEDKGKYSFIFHLTSGESITVNKLDVLQFIPETPDHLKSDDYLNKLALINQEWNRNQVKLLPGEFECDDKRITRVDIARNCLNSYLWEIILYSEENDETLPIAHGWFDFPKEKYRELFNQRNDGAFDPLKGHLVDWHDVESRFVNKTLLREFVEEFNIYYTDLSDSMYPLQAARLKKRKEIMWPERFQHMRDLQNDSSTFATFSPPGFYNKKDPRHTELGRFKHLNGLHLYHTKSVQTGRVTNEVEFNFDDPETGRNTRLFIGGIQMGNMPILSTEDANKGWKNSMGFGNHSFYESLADFNIYNTAKSDYYAYLTDGNGNWLDSHKIGIDGPIIHLDDENPAIAHIWLLSFERHAIIGHYIIGPSDDFGGQ